MREIKFRLWDGKSMHHNAIVGTGNALYIPSATGEYKWVTLTGVVPLQYAGLKDRNSKDIYEGDIVRWGIGGDGEYDQEAWHRYAVVEINPDIQFRIIYYIEAKTGDKKPTDNYVFHYGTFIYNGYLHVIGNIHENPELIGKEVQNG